MVIELDVKGNKASGTMTMNGQSKPIDVDLGGALVCRWRRHFDVIAALPLAEGYSVGFRNFDVQKQKPQLKQLKVVGMESVPFPRALLRLTRLRSPLQTMRRTRQTVWIAKDTRQVLKISAVLPSFGGAILTSEL